MSDAAQAPFTKRDYVATLTTGGIMLLWICLLRFPLLDWDSSRYMSVMHDPFRRPDTAPTLQYLVFWPFWRIFGPWTYPVIAQGLLLYTTGLASKITLGRVSAFAILGAFVLSGMHLWANFVLIDVYFTIGLLALFCLAFGRHRPAMLTILVYASLAHSANVLSLAPLAFVALACRRQWSSLILFTSGFLSLFVTIAAATYALHGHFTPLSIHGAGNVVGRVMADFPDTVDEYAAAHPDSAFARKKDVFQGQLHAWETRPDLKARVPAWFPLAPTRWPFVQAYNAINVCFRGPFPVTHWPKEGFDKTEQRAYVTHVLRTRPFAFCATMVENVALFLLAATVQGHDDWPYNYAYSKQTNPRKDLVQAYAPSWEPSYARSLQMRGKDNPALRMVLFPGLFFGIAFGGFLILNSAVLAHAAARRQKLDAVTTLSLLALLACASQSFVMANFSSMHPRYFTTLYFIAAFAGCIALAQTWKSRRQALQQSEPIC